MPVGLNALKRRSRGGLLLPGAGVGGAGLQAAALGSSVDLAQGVAWHAVYWADSTDTAAIAHGGNVTTIHDQIGAEDLTGIGGGIPTMLNPDTALNNRRSLLFVSGGYGPTMTSISAQAQPFTIVSVAKFDVINARNYVHDGKGSSNRMILSSELAPDVFGIHAGSSIEGGASDTNGHLFQALYNGGSSQLKKDGTQIASGNAGAHSYIGLTLGSAYSGGGTTTHFDGRIAFVGVYFGSVESDPGWATWKAACAAYYGLTVA